MAQLTPFLLSLPERVLRSVTGLAAGLLREIGEVTIPQTVRRGHLYSNLVDATLRFLIEQVGGVQGVYPTEEKLAEDFLMRRTAGKGIELIGVLAFCGFGCAVRRVRRRHIYDTRNFNRSKG